MVSILLEFPLSNRLRPPVRLSWIKNMNMKKSRLWLSLLILSYIQTILIFFKSCMSFIASCSSPAMLNLFLQAFKLCPHSLMLMYSGKWCRVSLGICWENSPLSSNWLFLFKIFGLTLFELQIRQCFACFLPTSQFSSTFQVSGLFVLLDFFDLYDIFEFSVIVDFSGIIRLSCFPFLSIFLEMQKLLFHKPHLLTVLCQYYGLRKKIFLEK